MVSMNSGISWCDGTINPWVGCNKVSAGCDHCYAETLVNRLQGTASFKHPFDKVTLHLDRLEQLRKMGPKMEGGRRRPFLAFVNSMSDMWHDDVPESALHLALDAFEANPFTVFQILTKRPIRARQVLVNRYGNSGIPANIWIGVSAEDNRVAKRLDIMRSIRDRTGGNGTFFVSVEPIVGPTDMLNFDGFDWVILGGESGPGARVMLRDWLMAALTRAEGQGAALWYKQAGQPRSHPNLSEAPLNMNLTSRFQWLVDNGWEKLPDEKGGATVDRLTYRHLPPAYHALEGRLNAPSLPF
jgi:protein gp37